MGFSMRDSWNKVPSCPLNLSVLFSVVDGPVHMYYLSIFCASGEYTNHSYLSRECNVYLFRRHKNYYACQFSFYTKSMKNSNDKKAIFFRTRNILAKLYLELIEHSAAVFIQN